MTLILSNDDVEKALSVRRCFAVMEESYREQAASRAVNRPTCHSYLPHSLPNSTYSFKSVDGGIGKYGVLALRVTSDVVQEQRIHGAIRLEKLPLAGKGMFVGLVQLFSAETGELLAIMPDGLIQQTRVGVTSALGMKVMARQEFRGSRPHRFRRAGKSPLSFHDRSDADQKSQSLQSQSRASKSIRRRDGQRNRRSRRAGR